MNKFAALAKSLGSGFSHHHDSSSSKSNCEPKQGQRNITNHQESHSGHGHQNTNPPKNPYPQSTNPQNWYSQNTSYYTDNHISSSAVAPDGQAAPLILLPIPPKPNFDTASRGSEGSCSTDSEDESSDDEDESAHEATDSENQDSDDSDDSDGDSESDSESDDTDGENSDEDSNASQEFNQIDENHVYGVGGEIDFSHDDNMHNTYDEGEHGISDGGHARINQEFHVGQVFSEQESDEQDSDEQDSDDQDSGEEQSYHSQDYSEQGSDGEISDEEDYSQVRITCIVGRTMTSIMIVMEATRGMFCKI